MMRFISCTAALSVLPAVLGVVLLVAGAVLAVAQPISLLPAATEAGGLLGTLLTAQAATMDVEYELVEIIAPDQLPSGVFDRPALDRIVERNTFLTPLQAEELDFDVHYIGSAHGDHTLQSIVHYYSSADSVFYVTPRRGVWVTYQLLAPCLEKH